MRKYPRAWAIGSLMVGFGLVLAPDLAPAQTLIEVMGTEADLGETPLVVPLSRSESPGNYRLVPDDGGTPVPANIYDQSGKLYLGFVLDRIPAQGHRRFSLAGNPSRAGDPAGVTLTPAGKRVAIAVDGQPLTEYVPDDGPKPFLYPLLGPSGAELTRAYPMKQVEGEKTDHPHHRSFWYAHGNVNGIDFWSILPGHGFIKETSRSEMVGGSAVGLLLTTDDWLDPNGKVVVTDERVLRIYATKEARVLDFDVTLKAPADPATFADTKEGTFALRVATSMDVTSKKGGKIVTSEGLVDKAAWGKAASWVDYTGPVGGETFGIAILDHPDSFRHPTTWHVRDYGLFAANPFGWHDFGRKESGATTLAPGETMTFRYRVILHRGDTASAHLDRAFQAYAHPPTVAIK